MKTMITIKGRTFEVSVRAADQHTAKHGAIYELRGPRGAAYFTMRNANHPEAMFVCDMRKFGMASTMKDVWLTDKNGTLEVM